MNITLDIVRQVLKEALGFESFVASFISEVTEDPGHPTAGITRDGQLRYNPEFVNRHLTCKEDLFSLIFHELLHPMFGHFIYNNGEIENIAADAIINAVISTLYPGQSLEGNLFRKTHAPRGLEGLLRPESNMRNSRYRRIYDRLYSAGMTSQRGMTTGELIQTLRILAQTEDLHSVQLIGTHEREGGQSTGSLAGASAETMGKIAEDIKRSLQHNGNKQGGYSCNLMAIMLETLRTHLSIKKALLLKFVTKRKVDKFKELYQDRRAAVSPVPVNPSKQDMVLLASGVWPCYFHNHAARTRERERGLAVYLDVSGSVNKYLPKIVGVLKSLRNDLTTIFQFSNKVVETSFERLLKGNIRTTYGTDFDCIAQHVVERAFDRAVIITDGYADMTEENQEALEKRNVRTLAILFDGRSDCPEWTPFGDAVQLEEVTDGWREKQWNTG